MGGRNEGIRAMGTPVAVCPRCHAPLRPDTDPDSGYCFNHGTVYLGVPLDLETRPLTHAPRTRTTKAV